MYTTKKLMAVLLAMLACMSASAQVRFGAKVGLDLTNFWGKECGHHMVLKYYPTQDFSIDFGPQVGFNVYSKYTMGKHEATNYKDMTKAVDFGLGLGCTYDLDKNVFIQLRYTLGLTNAFKVMHGTAYSIGNYRKNGNAQLAFGMKF